MGAIADLAGIRINAPMAYPKTSAVQIFARINWFRRAHIVTGFAVIRILIVGSDLAADKAELPKSFRFACPPRTAVGWSIGRLNRQP